MKEHDTKRLNEFEKENRLRKLKEEIELFQSNIDKLISKGYFEFSPVLQNLTEQLSEKQKEYNELKGDE